MSLSQSIPNDPSGLYDYIKKFVETNMDVCKWGGFAIVIVEVNRRFDRMIRVNVVHS